jgi:hypothetical protein
MPLSDVSDRLQHLQALFAAKSPSFDSWLADLERIALENTPFALDLAKWKMNVLGPEATSKWLERLPPSTREDLCMRAPADCYGALQRWEDLESSVGASWRERSRFALVCSLGLKPGSETSEDPNAPGNWPCRKLKYILRNCLRFSRWQERTSAMCAKSYG